MLVGFWRCPDIGGDLTLLRAIRSKKFRPKLPASDATAAAKSSAESSVGAVSARSCPQSPRQRGRP
jgi:hypothetical protein